MTFRTNSIPIFKEQVLCHHLGSTAIGSNKNLKEQSQRLLRLFRNHISRVAPTEIPLLHTNNAPIQTLRYLALQDTTNKNLVNDFSHPSDYFTQVYQDWILEMALRGWRLSWLRLIFLPPQTKMKLHSDHENQHGPTWRFHLPLQSNKNCFIEWKVGKETKRLHLSPKQGPCLLRIDLPHRAVNNSERWRVHLVASPIAIPPSLEKLWSP